MAASDKPGAGRDSGVKGRGVKDDIGDPARVAKVYGGAAEAGVAQPPDGTLHLLAPKGVPRKRLLRRLFSSAKAAAYFLAATLASGVLGYRYIAHLSWLISFHQASLLLAGMGPVVTDLSDAGRVFESLYAMFCGVILLGSTGILFAPFIHHLLHAFHVEDSGGDK